MSAKKTTEATHIKHKSLTEKAAECFVEQGELAVQPLRSSERRTRNWPKCGLKNISFEKNADRTLEDLSINSHLMDCSLLGN